MEDKNVMQNVVKMAIDAYHGNVETYSTEKANETVRKALLELNNGKTSVSYRDIRDHKVDGLFAIIEEILNRTVVEGLEGDEYFNALVDFRNIAAGDKNAFITEDNDLYVVAKIANGTQGIRRQRIVGAAEASIPTYRHAVRIYEELDRILAGRTDFGAMIAKVAESFRQELLNGVYGLWGAATADELGGNYFATGGDYDEDELLDMISHVEAAAGGKTATILGTKKALRNLAPSINSVDSTNDLYNLGYYGKFYGTPVIATPQRHKVGSEEFVFADDCVTIIAGDQKPIKVVYEGDPLIIMGDPLSNADLTQEYFYAEKYGMGIVLAGRNSGIGRYEFDAD